MLLITYCPALALFNARQSVYVKNLAKMEELRFDAKNIQAQMPIVIVLSAKIAEIRRMCQSNDNGKFGSSALVSSSSVHVQVLRQQNKSLNSSVSSLIQQMHSMALHQQQLEDDSRSSSRFG